MNRFPKGNDPCPCGNGKTFKNCHGLGRVDGDERAEYTGNSHSLIVLLVIAAALLGIIYALRLPINARPEEFGAYASWKPVEDNGGLSGTAIGIFFLWVVSLAALTWLAATKPDILASKIRWYGIMGSVIAVSVAVPGYWAVLYTSEGATYQRAISSRHAGILRNFIRSFPDTRHASAVLAEIGSIEKSVLLHEELTILGRSILSTSAAPRNVAIALKADTSALGRGPNVFLNTTDKKQIGDHTTSEIINKLADQLEDALPRNVSKYAIHTEWLDEDPQLPFDRPLILFSYQASYGRSFVNTSTGDVSSHTNIFYELAYYLPGSTEPNAVVRGGVGPGRVQENVDEIVARCRSYFSDWEKLAAP